MPRAGAALRGGRLAVHAHRRQHARHLRLREGAAARRATRRGGRGQPRARDLRPRVRPHRRLRARAREPGALGRAGARVRSRRGGSRPAHARLSPGGLRGRLRRAPAPPTRRRSSSPSRRATFPPRSSCTRRSPSSPPTVGTGRRVEREAEASGQLAEREGLTGKLCFPYMMRGMLRWREGKFDESAKGLRRAADLAEQVGRSEVAFQSLFWLAASLRQRGDYADADTELARALDLCERAGLVAQSVEAISARAVNLALRRKAGRGARGRRRGRAARRPAPVSGRQGGEPRGPRRRGGRSGRVERRADRGPRRVAGARPAARRRPLRLPARAPAARLRTPTKPARRCSRPPPRRSATASTTSRSSPSGCCPLSAHLGESRPCRSLSARTGSRSTGRSAARARSSCWLPTPSFTHRCTTLSPPTSLPITVSSAMTTAAPGSRPARVRTTCIPGPRTWWR